MPFLLLWLVAPGCSDDDDSGTGNNNNADGGVECALPSDCPGTDDDCQQRTCAAGACGLSYTSAGSPLSGQTAGDCIVRQCDGAGGVTEVADASDIPVDENPCTYDLCQGTLPSNPSSQAGTPCGTDLVCDGQGACVGCLAASDCPGTDGDCRWRTCSAGTCGFGNATMGTPVPTQAEGDCQEVQCDGAGGTTSVDDDGDVPANAGPCSTGLCTFGTPSQTQVAAGTSCGTDLVCNAQGACVSVECANAQECPAPDTLCAEALCQGGLCSFAYATPGTTLPAYAQTGGDCQVIQCAGGDATTLAVDDTDLPLDGIQCTEDLCTSGVPSNPPLASGTACSEAGGLVCDGDGHCVECLSQLGCPAAATLCATATCTGNTCGFAFAEANSEAPQPLQTAGDCHVVQCTGGDATALAVDDSDLPDDGDPCTQGVCTDGTASQAPLAPGESCGLGLVCNAEGSCVPMQCSGPGECPAPITPCATAACSGGFCTYEYALAGSAAPPITQTAGDCQLVQCTGGDSTISVADNADLPVDGNPCTSDLCTLGVPSNPNLALGAPCGTDLVCNGAGTCVAEECDVPADCPQPSTACAAATCTLHFCGFTYSAAGTPAPAGLQTAGDCHMVQCSGGDSTISVVDDSDLPVDGLQCTSDLCTAGVPSNPGLGAGTACTEGGGQFCDGAGHCVECLSPVTCPAASTLCATATCVSNTCGFSYAAPGSTAPLAAQTAGDCQVVQCTGGDSTVSVADNADIPVDSNPCTADLCTVGVPSNPNVTLGTPCGTDLVCDGAGACIAKQCDVPADCPQPTTPCATATCAGNLCGFSYAAAGSTAPPSSQTAGDCQVLQCSGADSTVSVADNADIPVDGKECTQDVCTAGVPSNPFRASGEECAENGGLVCDGAGTCVQCVIPAGCPAPATLCATATCVSYTCGFDYTPAGTTAPPGAQTSGDCRIVQCTGADSTTSIADDADLPVDGNACTEDLCTVGVPSNPNIAAGAPCDTDMVCDGAGNCVAKECTVPEDCPAPTTSCATRVCQGNLCGFTFLAAGTPAPGSQTPGDCQEVQCTGGDSTASVADNTDLPVDGLQCTDDLCTLGVASNPDSDAGTPCDEGGGQVCDGLGSCVECNTDAHCAGSTGGACVSHLCQAPTCTDGIWNGGETDVDCGGATTCPRCDQGEACAGDDDCASSTCDTGTWKCGPFVVIDTEPADAAVNVSLDATLLVTFSGAVDPTSLETQTQVGPCSGSVQISADAFVTCVGFESADPVLGADDSEVGFVPLLAWLPGTTYQIRVTPDVLAAGGETLDATFLTGTGFTTQAAQHVCPGQVVISQVYGGGGNSGAPYTNDFVELHNLGQTSLSITGWSIQYTSATGSSWGNQLAILSGVIQAGGYYLVQLQGGATGSPLPTPDATGAWNMSATAGKVALVSNATPLTGTCPTSTSLVDLVGFGGTANCYEGGGPTPAPSNSTAVLRAIAGCMDTDNNNLDFATGAPTPRNGASPVALCSCVLPGVMNETDLALEADYCNLQYPTDPISLGLGGLSPDIYGRIYEAGVTEPAGASGQITAQLGYGPDGVDPSTTSGWRWFSTAWNVQVGNDDEYSGSFWAPELAGTYRYTYRFSLDGGATWTYCDIDGAGSNSGLTYSYAGLGTMTVVE